MKAALPRRKAAEYVGRYRGIGGYGEELVATVVADSARGLILQSPLTPPGGPPGSLVYRGGETFQLDDKQLTFTREKGRVVKLSVDAVYAYLVLRRKP